MSTNANHIIGPRSWPVIAALAVGLAGCADQPLTNHAGQEGASRVSSDSAVVRVDTDRNFAQSVDELIASADVIATGKLLPTFHEESQSSDGVYVHLGQDFVIEQVMKGDVASGAVIQVLRSVRSKDRVPLVEFDAQPLEPGGRYLLFLRRETSLYVTVGGPQGQFDISAGKIIALSQFFSTSSQLEGRTVNDVAAIVGRASPIQAP